jgi:predicted RNA-binding Zn-ribbon protein involved in translation (DUF1610 family)
MTEQTQESGCPECGNTEIYQIYDDNLPRGIQDSIGHAMAIECPRCCTRLIVTDQGNDYSIRRATWLDQVHNRRTA